MGTVDIQFAQRGGSKAVIGIAGISGSGKTYTALQIARGMVSHPSEIGFLDTENKRGSLYADILDGQFRIGDLYAPFSPSRYSGAIKDFQEAGVKVLVIDSVSHEHEGQGGLEDIANAPLAAGKKMADWKSAKREHKTFMNTLLQCDMHIIVCIRAREKMDFKNPNLPVSLGIQPVCEKNFMFEMTASLMMEDEGKKQLPLKMPSFLRPAFKPDANGYIGADTGKMIIDWINTGSVEDLEVKRAKTEMLMACEGGLKSLEAVVANYPKELKAKLVDHWHVCKASAEEYDRQRAAAEEGDGNEEITFDDLQTLFDFKKEYLEPEDLISAERIIKNKEVASYSKLHSKLKGL